MASKLLPIDSLGPVNPIGSLCFDARLKKVEYERKILNLSDGALRFTWCLLHEPVGVGNQELIGKCWPSGVSGNLHKAAWEFRKQVHPAALIHHNGIYRLDSEFLANGQNRYIPFEERIAKLRANRGLPIAEFLDLLFEPGLRGAPAFASETLISAPDPFALVRANPAAFAASLHHRNFYFIATSSSAIDRIPGTLASVYQAAREAAPHKPAVDPLDLLYASLNIVISDLPSAILTDPVYLIDSHNSSHCMRFILTPENAEAIFVEHGDRACGCADSLRGQFLPKRGQSMIRFAGGSTDGTANMEKLHAGVAHAFDRFRSAELSAKALSICFEDPQRKQPAAESNPHATAVAVKAY